MQVGTGICMDIKEARAQENKWRALHDGLDGDD
jgi:hypothetical protein